MAKTTKGLREWRAKQKPGAIMKPSTFKKIEKKAAAAGATSPEKVAGAAYWATARAKYRGKKHSGGDVTKDGLYELQEGEKVIPAPTKAYEHEEVCAMPCGPDAEGQGHWEIDGTDVKFAKE